MGRQAPRSHMPSRRAGRTALSTPMRSPRNTWQSALVANKVLQERQESRYVDGPEYDLTAWSRKVACPHLPENRETRERTGFHQCGQSVVGRARTAGDRGYPARPRSDQGPQGAPVRQDDRHSATQRYITVHQEGLVEVSSIAGRCVPARDLRPCLGGHMGILAAGRGPSPRRTGTSSAGWESEERRIPFQSGDRRGVCRCSAGSTGPEELK